jgi:hypothetical protein
VRGTLHEQGAHDRFLKDIVVPEPENSIAPASKPLIPDGIGRIVRVLPTIHFDGQFVFTTAEIGNIWTDWILTHKFESAQRP